MASRAAAAQARGTQRLLAHFGEGAFLRSGERVTVVITRAVELYGDGGVVDRVVTTASFLPSASPRARDALVLEDGGEQFLLDFPLERGDKYLVDWVLVPV